MMKKAICTLAIFAVFLSLAGCDPPAPRFKPTYEEWEEYVWVSKEEKAFITRSAIGYLGGQMEIDGEMCDIHITIDHRHSLMFEKFDDTVFMDKNGRIYIEGVHEIQIYGKTTYKKDSIICKGEWDSKNYAGQKIVFIRYAKDEVSPADFGFELESWDDFVPDWLVEAKSGGNTSKPAPAPAPEPTPQPAPEPIPTPEVVYLSADVLPTRSSRQPRRITD